MTLSRTITCRFYAALNRFLAPHHRYRTFSHTVKGTPSVKDTLEALGVPHTEIDCIIVDGRSVGFKYHIRGGEHIRIYPEAKTVKLSKVLSLKPRLPVNPKFVLDVHLGKLARHLRLLGCDAVYDKEITDPEIINLAHRERRIVLTRDIGLLKHKQLRHGYFVRAIDPDRQIREVVKYFALAAKAHPFRLCLQCNGKIRKVSKLKIIHCLPEMTKKYYKEFYFCRNCGKIYWQGAHYKRLLKIIKEAQGRNRLQHPVLKSVIL